MQNQGLRASRAKKSVSQRECETSFQVCTLEALCLWVFHGFLAMPDVLTKGADPPAKASSA